MLALERCSKITFSICVHETLAYAKCEQCYAQMILKHVENDIIIRVGWSISQLWNTVGR